MSRPRRNPSTQRAVVRVGTARTAVALAIAALAACFALAPAAQADRGIVGWIGSEHSGGAAGELFEPAGLAVNTTGAGGASPGDLYVADTHNARVDEFSPAGEFIRAFGYDVVRSGEDNSNVDTEYELDVAATGGSFTLSYEETNRYIHSSEDKGGQTAPLPFDATASEIQKALEAVQGIGAGNVVVSGSGPFHIVFAGVFAGDSLEGILAAESGELQGGSPKASLTKTVLGGAPETCNANPPSNDVCNGGSFGRGQETEVGGSLGGGPLGSELTGVAVNQATGDVYAYADFRVNEFSADGRFLRAFGQDVVRSGPDRETARSALQELTLTATGGNYTLEFGGEQTGELPFDAGVGEIQAALEALASIGSGNVTVAESGSGSYEIAFAGALADNPEPAISASSASGEPLSGGGATVQTVVEGSTGFDVCEASREDTCQLGGEGVSGGALGRGVAALAVAPSGSPNAGDVLVADSGNHRIEEFSEGGTFVRAFGGEVVAAGPDRLGGGFEECVAAAGDACREGSVGEAVGQFSGFYGPVSIAEKASGAILAVEDREAFRVQEFAPQPGPPALSPALFGGPGAPDGSEGGDAPRAVAIGASGNVLVAKGFPEGATPSCPDGLPSAPEVRVEELSADGSALLDTTASCDRIRLDEQSTGLVFDPTGEAIYLSNNFSNDPFSPQRVLIIAQGVNPPSISGVAVEPHAEAATITATIDPNGSSGYPNPPRTSYHLEYRLASESEWKRFGGDIDIGGGGAGVPVTVHLGGLEGNRPYEARLVAAKQFGEGITVSEPKEFTTLPVPPSIDGFSSSNLGATTALLHAKVNPRGLDTTCRFEYGTTTAYGHTAPCEPEDLGSAYGDQAAVAHLSGLAEGAAYHFRVLATSSAGTGQTEDQSFEFLPPNCPNATVRQQTQSNYLPDCRGYELVSPGSAEGTILYAGGPNTGRAVNPPRFAFVGRFSALPGTEPINTGGDLYVATRTAGGWASRYIGLPGSEAGCMAGPPTDPWSGGLVPTPTRIQDHVLADPSMSRFLDFLDYPPAFCESDGNGTGDATSGLAVPSNAGYLWTSEGTLADRVPTDLATIPGAAEALACPQIFSKESTCSAEATASGDLRHFVFSSNRVAFAAGGLAKAPGSAYDDDLATGEVKLISTLPGGKSIPQDPEFAKEGPNGQLSDRVPGGEEEFLRFPFVSGDGSRVLISTATAGTPGCDNERPLGGTVCQRFVDTPVHLYMSIDDGPDVEVSKSELSGENVAVSYVGAAEEGAKVFFTTDEQLTSEDRDHSADLYMWSQRGEAEGRPLTLLSRGDDAGNEGEAGNSDACHPALEPFLNGRGEQVPWTSGCGVVAYSGWDYANALAGRGGNAISDSAIASGNGDVYFYSPELLDGERGIEGQQNLYDYREGRPRFVATFAPGHTCLVHEQEFETTEKHGMICSAGPIARIEVSPDDSHMAFVSADRLTFYDNTDAGGSCQLDAFGQPTGETQCTEMYSYTPATDSLICDSCNPSGQPPTSDVYASQDGLFMTDDGRVFFSTDEGLVPQDTNRSEDVYEFADGRPHLITAGTGIPTVSGSQTALVQTPGLVGVSANGADVYFSTFDTLVAEDQNGEFLKFYDARTGGGFLRPAPAPACAAAEECHGSGSKAPTPPQIASNGDPAAGGNANPKPHRRRGAKSARRHRRRHRRRGAGHRHGGPR